MLLRRSHSSFRWHAALLNGGCHDAMLQLVSQGHQRTINITRRSVSWRGATLNVRLWFRQLRLLARIHARHVQAHRGLGSLQNGSCPWMHPSASSPGIITERSASPIDTAPALGQRFQMFSFGLDNVIFRSHTSIHETKRAACSGGRYRLGGLTRRSTRTQPARAASMFLGRDFSSSFQVRSPVGPVNCFR